MKTIYKLTSRKPNMTSIFKDDFIVEETFFQEWESLTNYIKQELNKCYDIKFHIELIELK